ncbi:Calx-beta domain protein [Roseimaritima multifibrata]|uniref:Calx-beta domain protein n=1 Tax=Roseimaritima multifibrata TaxID=1930274 RepID=A0A517MA24_9BACT|nr:choice-of-anchor M domain-containing protein [Roseimaritima multifibrata]QDS91740.1 Calx-beta domain protein [Roseimaritima multifibrata]
MFPSFRKSKRRQQTAAKNRRARAKHRCRVEALEQRRLLTAELVSFVTTEHVDLNIQRSGSEWSLGAKNSDGDPPVQYDNNQAVLYAGEKSVFPRPASSEYDFIGVDPGQDFYLMPQSQNPESLYLGFASYGVEGSVDRYSPTTESKGRVSGSGRYVKATLSEVRHTNPDGTDGDGHFSMWQSGSFGGAVVAMSSYDDGVVNPDANGLDVTDGISTDDAMWILNGGHSHFSFGFTDPGRYEVDVKLSAYFGDDSLAETPNEDGFSQSDNITLYFSISSVGQLQFDASSYSVSEDAGTASIDVVRIGGSDGRIGANYATTSGTATSGSDYTTAAGSLEFLDGETRQTITIPILEDLLVEGNETFNVVLTSPSPGNLDGYIREVELDANGLIGTNGSTIVTIVDNDQPINSPPTISDVEDQVVAENSSTPNLTFTVGDAETAATELTVTATSSNQAVVPDANLVLGGSGTNRTLMVTPAADQAGLTTITVAVTDGDGGTTTETFIVEVSPVNSAPTLSDISNQTTNEDVATAAIGFVVGDPETEVGDLAVTATSSNSALVPEGNIVFAGSGANRTATITPAPNQFGTTTITITVTDQEGLTATDNFLLTVDSVNDAPTISSVANQSTSEDLETGAIAFTIGDLETTVGDLTVTATSSDTTLVPNANILLGGSDANRTVTITPAENQTGSTVITLTVSDGALTATETFALTVGGVNDRPTISPIETQATDEGTPTAAIAFTIGDLETAAGDLSVTATSSDTTLVPNANIVLGGSGTNRTVTIAPAENQTGSTTITLTVSDGTLTATETFDVLVGQGVVEFESAATLVNEQAGYQTVKVQRTGGSQGSLVVNYETVDGTATAGSDDYVASSGTLVFGPGETSKVITVQLGDNSLDEANETFSLVLSGTLGTIGAQATSVLTINDTPAITRELESGFISTGIPSQSTTMGTSTAPIFFTVSDAETDSAALVVSAVSNNPALLPDSGILLAGSGSERSITLSPLAGVSGTARVYLTLTDANGASITRDFAVFVGATSSENAIAIPDAIPDVVLTADDAFTLNYSVADPTWVTTVSRSNTTLFNTPSTSSSSDLRTRPSSGGSDRTLRIRPSDLSTSAGRYGSSTVTLGFTGTGVPEPQTFNVRVNPRAVADNNLLAIPGTTSTLDVLANDVTPMDGHRFEITSVSSPAHGTLEIDSDGELLRYTPTNLTAASDQFTYTVTISSDDEFNGYSFTGIAYVKIGGYVVVDSATASQHVDMDFDYIEGEWIQRIRTGASIVGSVQSGTYSPTIIDSDEGVLFIDPSTKLARPNDAFYDVLGVPAGADIWYGPTSASGDKLFLGFATESTSGIDSYTPIGDARATGNYEWMAIQLVGFSGPGHATVFQGGDVAFDTFDGLNSADDTASGGNASDTYWTLSNSHSHPAWFFTEPGNYALTFQTTVRIDGQFVTSPETTFHVAVDTISGDASRSENSPALQDDAATLPEDSIDFAIDVLANDSSNPDGFESLLITSTSAASHGTVGIAADGKSLSYTPDPDFYGNDSFTYTVTDEHGGIATATVDVTVDPVNIAPTIAVIEDQHVTEEGSTGAIPLIIGDAETAAEALSVTVTSSNTNVVPNENIVLGGSGDNRTLTITPTADPTDTATITVTVTDGGGLQTSTTFNLTITTKNVVPFGLPDSLGSGLDYVFEPELADINGDGHVDVLTASLGADKVVWFENLGDGTYGPEQIVSAAAGYPWEAHLADLDADGDPDVIVGGYFGDLVWHENLGGSFGPAQSIGTDLYGPFIRSADVDGDGKLDVLVARDMGGDIYWYRNEGDGVFGSRNVIATGLNEAAGFVARDLNGDGLPEAITGESGAGQLAYFVNEGGGTFGAKQTVASTSGAVVYAADDLNGDGIDDLLVVGLNSLDIGFHPGQSDGTVGPFTALPSVSTPYAATSADFDQDGDFDVLIGSYGGPVVWLQNFGGGNFSDPMEITREVGQVNGIATADTDGDGDPDVVAAALARGEVFVIPNRLGEFATTVQPPISRTYPAGQNLDLSIHLGIPVTVTGTPSVTLQVGDQDVEATYLSGSGTTTLLFRYTVVPTDADNDGIELVGSSIHLNGGSILGPFGNPVDLTLPAVDLSGVLVNGSAPFVQTVERASTINPTAAAELTFQVTFSEAVTDVDTEDFGLTLDEVSGAVITGVSGSGDEYMVTVSTGTGSGTIGLEVLDTATIEDGEGNPLVEDFFGGEVFSIHRRPAREITNFYTEGHGDIRVAYADRVWNLDINPDALDGPFEADEVLIVGGPDSQVTAPSDPEFDFLGAEAGSDIYVLPQSNVPPTIPDLGIGGSGIATGTLASYHSDDPRVDATAPWVELQLVDMRGPEGGQFSVYSSELEGPNAWIATSDGITDQDGVFIQAGSHNHLNWAFTKPGIYEVDVFASAFLDRNANGTFDEGVDRYTESGIVTYYFSIDPSEGPQPYPIAADNQSPVANDDSYAVVEDGTLTVPGPGVLDNDTDANGDTLKTAVVSGPENGSLTLNPDGSFTYTPDPNFHGSDTFTYTTTDVRYQVTPLGTLGGTTSYALDVNNLNQVSGNSGIVVGASNPLHAFRWTDGGLEDLGVVAGTGSNNFSRGYAINDLGVVVGESDNNASKAFRWENGIIANLGTLGGTSAVASDINNLNQIVGSSSNGTATKPFVYVDGAMLELPTIAGNAASSGRAWGISPEGQFIVGVTRADDAEFLSHATLWERQADDSYTVVDMGALMDEHNYSYTYAVNDSGNAVGASVVGTVSPTSSTSLYHGFIYHDGHMIDVGTLDYLSYSHSELKDINATDQFVGYVAGFYNYPTFGGAAVLGELAGEETAMIDLNELIDNDDWTLLIGEGINNGRSIVGYGKLNGATQAYLLTPVSPDNDNRLFGNVATVTIEVTPEHDAPVTVDDSYVVGRGNAVHGNVLFNDSDPDGDVLVAELGTTVLKGNLSFAPDGSFVYTPSDAFDGSDSFAYSVNDGTGRTSTGTVLISAAAEREFEAVLTEGHVDIGVAIGAHDHEEEDHDEDDHDGHDHDHDDHAEGEEDPEWNLHVHDHDSEAEYHPDEALLYVGMDAIAQRPAGAEYDFIGTDAGESVFVLPAVENPDLLFLGLGTEEIEDGTFLDGSLTLRLESASGPGHFSMWTSALDGSPAVAMATSDGITETDLIELLEGNHTHVNFGFTEMGTYRITFQASGTLADGDVVASEDVTYFFKVGNTADAIEVQNGMTQRSYIRDLDILFGSDDGLDEILADSDRVQIMKYDLNGENGSLMAGSAFELSASGNALSFDFGAEGLGGNRNSNAGDGYYQIGIDADGDGEFETVQSFYRMLGDLNGDRKVDIADRMAVMSSLRNQNPDSDVNGDGVINSADLALVSRAFGKKLKDGLLTDGDDTP